MKKEFKVGDRIIVTCPKEVNYNKIGVISDIDNTDSLPITANGFPDGYNHEDSDLYQDYFEYDQIKLAHQYENMQTIKDFLELEE